VFPWSKYYFSILDKEIIMRSYKKKFGIVLPAGVLFGMALWLSSCTIHHPSDYHDQNAEASASFHYQWPVDGADQFSLQNVNGNVEIIG
jgi:hypothetical protein